MTNAGEVYPYSSHVIGPNFVTVKLSSKIKYDLWRMQMECLIKSQHMVGFINDQSPSPTRNGKGKGKVEDMEAWDASDSLVKGWILGSLSQEAVNKVVNHFTHKQKNTDFTAKDLWDGVQRIYGPSAASTSNPSIIVDVGEAYPYPSVIGPNFVTVKLSGKNKYNLWETQMLCLLKSHQMYGFIDGQFPRPAGNGEGIVGDLEAWIISDSLVKGWIFGSLSDEAAGKAVNHLTHMQQKTDFTAKDLWDELQHSYGPSVREQAAEIEVTPTQEESVRQVSSVSDDVVLVISESEDAKSKDGEQLWRRRLYEDILQGKPRDVINRLERYGLNPWVKITNNGNTILHVAVSSSTENHELLERLLEKTPKEKLLDLVNSDGSTLLHVAAIGGNIKAVNILVERNPELLLAKDKEGHIPLALSVSNIHFYTSGCLFEHMREKCRQDSNIYFSGKSGQEIVVLAISCYDFLLARKIINDYPDAILDGSDAVLTALAQNFPRELNFWERRGWKEEYNRIVAPYRPTFDRVWNYADSSRGRQTIKIFFTLFIAFCVVKARFCGFLKVFVRLFLVDTNQIHEDATNLLFDVCTKILTKDNSGSYHQYYTPSIFEATRRNASTFIRTIMMHFPDAIWSTNEDGHNFIQYSVISRSEKIYNLLYEMSEHKNIYKTIKDPSENNLLHLVARLGPNDKLVRVLGPALQIQRELQWFKEVEQFVCPINRLQKNADGQTPEMVFMIQHKDLMIEGNEWIKKISESYSITSTLIITIVFAATITVPGGNNQESGIPIFTNNIAFTIFAISDAISLFTAVTSLLIFLSILAIHQEAEFLYKLPTKLIVGLIMLFLSTTTMIIAFGATLFIVFGQSNFLMLIPIGVLTCLPITPFVTLQCPLIVELIKGTYGHGIFVRERVDYFY